MGLDRQFTSNPTVDLGEYANQVMQGVVEPGQSALLRFLSHLERTRRERRTLFLAGNGGSASTASHVACDFSKSVTSRSGLPGLRCVALTDTATITAYANDEHFDDVFANQVRNLGQPRDTLMIVSASGKSPNILKALECADGLQMETLGLLGSGGGDAAQQCNQSLVTSITDPGIVESVHLTWTHYLTDRLTLNDY